MKNGKLVHLDLFSGLGGNSYAADRVWPGIEHVFCEIEPYCTKILQKHWPKATIHPDITKLDARGIGPVFLATGGFPCQPYSVAGNRKGKEDDRDLWPEMFRVIKECRPTWVIGENNPGFVSMELDRSISDLEGAGYAVRVFDIPACGVDAKHRRHRIWIVAYATQERGQSVSVQSPKGRKESTRTDATRRSANVADSDEGLSLREKQEVRTGRDATQYGSEVLPHTDKKHAGHRYNGKAAVLSHKAKEDARGRKPVPDYLLWDAEPRVGRVADGIPNRMDRIAALGNSIVPQVAEEIMRAIRNAPEGVKG